MFVIVLFLIIIVCIIIIIILLLCVLTLCIDVQYIQHVQNYPKKLIYARKGDVQATRKPLAMCLYMFYTLFLSIIYPNLCI